MAPPRRRRPRLMLAAALAASAAAAARAAMPEDYDGTAARFPDPSSQTEECGGLLQGREKLAEFSSRETLFCDPMRVLDFHGSSEVETAFDAVQAWEAEFPVEALSGWGVVAGVALVPWVRQPLADFAADLAEAWELDGPHGVLVVLRTGGGLPEDNDPADLPAAVVAGGYFDEDGALDGAADGWEADLASQVGRLLREGSPGAAVEVALNLIADAIGGGPGHGMPTLGGTNTGVKRELLEEWQSDFQKGEVWSSICAEERCLELFLDNDRMFSERFESFYHEAMSFPAINILAGAGTPPRRVLMLGGGDGGVATRVLSVDSVERLTLLDIDPQVINKTRHYFPKVATCVDDPRFEILHVDALEWVEENAESRTVVFDLIIIDFTDLPVGDFWSEPFYDRLRLLLSPTGLLVQNMGILHMPAYDVRELFRMHSVAFGYTYPITTFIPDYDIDYILAVSSQSMFDPWKVDWGFWQRQRVDTNYYSPEVHYSLFAAPADIKRWLNLEIEAAPGAPQVVLPDHVARGKTLQFPGGEDPDEAETEVVESTGEWHMEVTIHHFGYCAPSGGHCMEVLRSLRPILNAHTQHQDEALTLPAMNVLGRRAKRVLVVGGGTGYIAWLLLHYKSVERIVVLEASTMVLDYIRKWFPDLSEALDDERVQLVNEDAYPWLEAYKDDPFDLVVMALKHSPWWRAAGKSRVPQHSRFLARLRRLLTPHGILAQEAGSIQTPRHARRMCALHRAAFPGGSTWPMAHGGAMQVYNNDVLDGRFLKPPMLSLLSSPAQFDPYDVDWAWWQEAGVSALHYTPSQHHTLFVLPRELQRLLRAPPPSGFMGMERTWPEEDAHLSPEEAAAAFQGVDLEASGCAADLLGAKDAAALLRALAGLSGMSVQQEAVEGLAPGGGVSAAAISEEAQLAIRTWPAEGRAAISLLAAHGPSPAALEALRRIIRQRLRCAGGVAARRAARGERAAT